MPRASMEGKKSLNKLLDELIEQLEKTGRTAAALADQKNTGPAKVTSARPSEQQNMNARASTNTQNAAATATTTAQNVTDAAVVQGEDETADAAATGGNVKADDETVSLSPAADSEEPPSVADFLHKDPDSDKDTKDVFADYQALIDGTKKAETTEETPAPDQELGSAGPSLKGGAAAAS